MLKNHWNTLKICVFGQTTKQPLGNLSPASLEKIQSTLMAGIEPSCLQKKCKLNHKPSITNLIASLVSYAQNYYESEISQSFNHICYKDQFSLTAFKVTYSIIQKKT